MVARIIKSSKDHRRLRSMIEEAKVTLTFSPAAGALTAGVNGTPHAGVTLTSPNAIGAVRWTITAGSLPTGLSLNATTGAISGTPTETIAAKAVTIRATDAYGNTNTAAYTMTITAS